MFDMQKVADKPSIEDLKISELTVAQFRQVMQECLDADRRAPWDREMAMRQALGVKSPGRPVW